MKTLGSPGATLGGASPMNKFPALIDADNCEYTHQFWACRLDEATKSFVWPTHVMKTRKEDQNASKESNEAEEGEDIGSEDEDDDYEPDVSELYLHTICVPPTAQGVHVVSLKTILFNGEEVESIVAVMDPKVDCMKSVTIYLHSEQEATLSLTEGDGPIHVSGYLSMRTENMDATMNGIEALKYAAEDEEQEQEQDDEEDEEMEEQESEESEPEPELPPKKLKKAAAAAKKPAGAAKIGQKKASKRNRESDDSDDSEVKPAPAPKRKNSRVSNGDSKKNVKLGKKKSLKSV